MQDAALSKLIRDVPDFPKQGIIFKDITPLLADAKAFKKVIDGFAALCKERGVTKVVGIESRGFIFGAAAAYAAGIGFVPARKKGKLPHKTISADFALEYGTDTIAMHADALTPADKVIIIDDLLATGGTMKAVVSLVKKLGAKIECTAFLCELGFLKGRAKLEEPIEVFLKF